MNSDKPKPAHKSPAPVSTATSKPKHVASSRVSKPLTLTQLLASDIARLPKTYNEDIENYLAKVFGQFCEDVARLSKQGPAARNVKEELGVIRALSDGILASLSAYMSGRTFDAYRLFSEALHHVRFRLQDLVFPLERLLGMHSHPSLERYGDLYRLRTGPMTQLQPKELFHIPFEKRQLVASQRYSIPGLPSLYLASSLWIAWEELGRPPLASLHASRFEGRGALRVLDFGLSPSVGLSTFGSPDDAEFFGRSAEGQAIIWPLMAACSLVRRFPEAPFVAEYIIPQFLLQWVQEQKELDGIRYFSTKLSGMEKAANRAFNFVFPVRCKASQGVCTSLQDSFALTSPLSWSMLQSWQPKIMSASLPVAGALEIAAGLSVPYSDTEFFTLEHKLKNLSARTIAAEAC